MKNNLPWIIVTISLFIMVACGDVDMARNLNRIPPADFVKDIPVVKEGRRRGQLDAIYQYDSKTASELQLDSLELGYDSLEIRIWLGHSMAIKKHVVVLKFFEDKWSGFLISYSMKGGVIESRSVDKIKPSSGWQTFIKQLYQFQILTLPNQDDLEDCGGCGEDGIGYEFEYATAKKYRFYSYCDPDYYKPTCKYAGTVMKIADLLEKEFEFTYIK